MSRQFDLGLVKGRDFTILGRYDTLADLQEAHPDPQVGDTYEIGTEAPYDAYIFTYDATLDDYTWVQQGSLRGEDGLPGGAVIYIVDEADGNGGIVRSITAVDISDDTVTPEYLQQGITAHNSRGEPIVGTGSTGSLPPATSSTLGGVIVGNDLLINEDGVLSVDKATSVSEDNTKPITAAAVYTEVGNINALLETI